MATFDSSMKILITGSTGYVGGRLKNNLEQKGYFLRCLVRSKNYIPSNFPPSTDYVIGDVSDRKLLLKALKGCDIAFYLIQSMGGKSKAIEKDRTHAAQFAEAAAVSKIKKIIYLAPLGHHFGEKFSTHLKNRQEIGYLLRANSSQVQVIEFRTSIVLGSCSFSFEMIRALVDKLPIIFCPKWMTVEAQPIAIDDLILYLIRAINCTLEGDPIFEIGGKINASYRELMKEYAYQRKLKRIFIPIPLLAPHLSSLFLALMTPLYANVGKKLIESAACATVVHDPLAQNVFQMKAMGYKEALTLSHVNENKIVPESRWNESISAAPRLYDWSEIDFGGRFIHICQEFVPLAPEYAFASIREIGGQSGYYADNWLWRLRGMVDLIIGGVGLRRGRRDPEHLRLGDVVDFWRVVEYVPGRSLKLLSEMKAPGRAILEFTVNPYAEGSEVIQKAIFDPVGTLGILYWYFFYPIRRIAFTRMMQGIINNLKRRYK